MGEQDNPTGTGDTVTEIFDQLKESTGQVISEVDRLRKSGQAALSGLQRRVADVDRRRKIQGVRKEIAALQGEIGQMSKALGLQVFGLYEEKKLAHPELVNLCEQIAALKLKLSEKEAELAALQPTPPPPPATCLTCGNELPAEGRFCPYCGTPRAEKKSPDAEPQTRFCAQCGALLRPGVKFCPKCGNQLTIIN
jgi:RNA polymerase subunit RPABC4/transcription elongation factor Spt4